MYDLCHINKWCDGTGSGYCKIKYRYHRRLLAAGSLGDQTPAVFLYGKKSCFHRLLLAFWLVYIEKHSNYNCKYIIDIRMWQLKTAGAHG